MGLGLVPLTALSVWALGAERGRPVLPGVLLGSALWMALEVGDRRRRGARRGAERAGLAGGRPRHLDS